MYSAAVRIVELPEPPFEREGAWTVDPPGNVVIKPVGRLLNAELLTAWREPESASAGSAIAKAHL